MGYTGGKISGHSRTDFKHKKVFSKSKRLLNNQPIFANVRIEQREETPTYFWFKKIKIVIAFAFLFTVLFLLSAYGTRLNNISIHESQVPKRILDIHDTKEKQEAAIMLYKSAKLYYKSGALDYAQDEITLVLNLYPMKIEALQLMHKILNKQCETKNKYCDSANDYGQYIALALNE